MKRRARLLVAAAVCCTVSGLFGGAVVLAVSQTFADVTPTNPFFDEVEWAAANGIVEGYGDGTFRPANVVTRQAAVAFLARYNTSLEVRHASVLIDDGFTGGAVNVSCPAGQRPLAGGGYAASTELVMQDSYPITPLGAAATDPLTANRWRVVWRTLGPPLATQATAHGWVLCAPYPVS